VCAHLTAVKKPGNAPALCDTPPGLSDCTDGPEAAAAGKKRMLEGHAGGPQGKRRKHEERGVNVGNASGLATTLVPHSSAQRQSRDLMFPQFGWSLGSHVRRGGAFWRLAAGACAWRATRKAPQARRVWCKPSQCIGPGHSSGAISFCSQEAPQGPCPLCVRSMCKDCGGSGLR